MRVITDHAGIRAAVDPLVSGDPVRHTALGTVLGSLQSTAWAALDGSRLAVRSSAAQPVHVAGDWTPALSGLRDALAALPDLHGVAGGESVVRAVATLVAPEPVFEPQRLYRCDGVRPPAGVPGRAVLADDSHRELAREWLAGFTRDVGERPADNALLADGVIDSRRTMLWLDPTGDPAALACRRTDVHGSARIGPVYTPPLRRGHGYASALTAVVAAAIIDEGAVPCLFADLRNPTSNKIYRAIGFRPVADRLLARLP